MRFKRIAFHNYRCFVEGSINFEETDGKNINALIGPNGGGKTESLFAFWWILYDFDFKSLLNKADTPYALNSDLHKGLEKSPTGSMQSCWAEVDIEFEGTTYRVRKTAEYTRGAKTISESLSRQLSTFNNDTGALSLAETNPDKVEKIVNRIIPRSVLTGILFDGERMQKLSSTDAKSVDAIKGVITDITNVALIIKSKDYFEEAKKSLAKELKTLSAKAGNSKLNDIIRDITDKEKQEKDLLEKQASELREQEEKKKRAAEISGLLEKNKLTSELERDRAAEKHEMENLNKQLDVLYKNFSASLKQANLLAADVVLDDVEETLEKYDVPQGLTKDAVLSILSRPKCICGCDMTDDVRKGLLAMIDTLPPDNITSTLNEVIRGTRMAKDFVNNELAIAYAAIEECEKQIAKKRERISDLTSQFEHLNDGVTDDDKKKAFELEKENVAISGRLSVIAADLPIYERDLKNLARDLDNLRKKREAASAYDRQANSFERKIAFAEKCISALDKIRETNKADALRSINARIQEAYSELSEDAKLGRNIYICQFDKSHLYQIIVYTVANRDDILNAWKTSGEYQHMLESGKTDEEIIEQAIIKSIDSSSTGQSKMNTLSFVKAILDYSNKAKDSELTTQKSYPLLVDAPFSDIAGDNLKNAASLLDTFSDQVILMLDSDKYRAVEPYMGTHVSTVHTFTKVDNENRSIIECKA